MEMAVSTPPAAATPVVENRAAPRVLAALVPSITGLRISPHGTDAKLVNISTTGLLAECGIRLKVGSAVTMTFEGGFEPTSTPARVVRCAVAAMGKGGSLVYHVGVSFDRLVPLNVGIPAPAPAPPPAPMPDPVAATAPDAAPVRAAVRNRW